MNTIVAALLSIPLLVALAACGGIPQEELDAVTAQWEEERAKVLAMEGRMQRAAHLEEARELLADGWGLPGAYILDFGAAVQSSGDPVLKEGLADLVQGFISGLDSLPPQLVGEALAAVQGSGDLVVAGRLQAFLFASSRGGGGPELLKVAQAVQDSDSQPLKLAVSNILETLLTEQPGATGLGQAIAELAASSTDQAVQQTLRQMDQPPPGFVQQVQDRLDAADVPALTDGFREAYLDPGGDRAAFYENVVDRLRQALGLPALEDS